MRWAGIRLHFLHSFHGLHWLHFLHRFHGLHWLHCLHRLHGLHGWHSVNTNTATAATPTTTATMLEAILIQSSNGLDFNGPDSWIFVDFRRAAVLPAFFIFLDFRSARCYPVIFVDPLGFSNGGGATL